MESCECCSQALTIASSTPTFQAGSDLAYARPLTRNVRRLTRDFLVLFCLLGGLLSIVAGPVGWYICVRRGKNNNRPLGVKISAVALPGVSSLLAVSVSLWLVGVGIPSGNSSPIFDVLFFTSNLVFIAFTVVGVAYLWVRSSQCDQIS